MFVMLIERESKTSHSDAGMVTHCEDVAQVSAAPMASVKEDKFT